jgi:hypothetical protein
MRFGTIAILMLLVMVGCDRVVIELGCDRNFGVVDYGGLRSLDD